MFFGHVESTKQMSFSDALFDFQLCQ
jgi:hypothetical protein